MGISHIVDIKRIHACIWGFPKMKHRNIIHPSKNRVPLKDFDHVLLRVPTHFNFVSFCLLFGHRLLTSFDELILPRHAASGSADTLETWQSIYACMIENKHVFPNCPCWNCNLWTQGPSPNGPFFSTPHATIVELGVAGPHYPWICPRTICASVPWGPPWYPCP